MNSQHPNPGNTRTRLLEAAEALFIEHGYEGMSLRQITGYAEVNLAAVNYHFGSKEALVQELLSAHLDRLNQERLQLLSLCEAQRGDRPMDASAVLSVLFVPAVRLSRESKGGVALMRLLGRVYSDPSPFIRDYLHDHYQFIYGRFFEAFARALPHLSRNELGMRLHFCLKALSGVLAGANMDELISAMCMGEPVNDSQMLARLISFISPMLTTSFESGEQVRDIERVMGMAGAAARSVDERALGEDKASEPRKPQGILPPWAAKVVGV
ncbi:TetR/AcrR family transcriptional regulator [Luteimonas aquatica]|uniref:TetR/AcrR family transcriptional regulator n=1 Tax=Luteimonas aquatica TaxID=450364 RepID=UPI001F58D36E|nr:TetR/AcrR family transcriptional regulator [Luteimonas aquatica]